MKIKTIHIIFMLSLVLSGCTTPAPQEDGVFTSVGADESYRRGVSAHNGGHLAQAEVHLREALVVNPRYLAALIELGSVLYDGGQGEEALDVYDRALSIRPGDPVALSGRAAALMMLGRFEEAIVSAERSFTLQPTDEALFIYATSTLEVMQDTTRAIEVLQMITASWPEREDARVFLSRIYFREGRSGEAVSTLDRGLIINSDSVILLEALASIYMDLEQWEQAIGLWQRYTSIRPGAVLPWIETARAQLEMGNFRLSMQTLEQAEQLEPGHVEIALLRGRAAYGQGYMARAQEEAAYVLSVEPDNLQGIFLQAQLMHAAGDSDSALRGLNSALQRYPEEEFLAVEMGRYLAQRGDSHDAVAVMESYWPFETIESRQYFLEVCLEAGELERFLAHLKVILDEQPELMEERLSLVQLVMSYPQQEVIAPHETLGFAREAFELSGGNRLAYRVALVDALMQMEEHEEAHLLVQQGLSDLPNSTELQQRLEILQRRHGER